MHACEGLHAVRMAIRRQTLSSCSRTQSVNGSVERETGVGGGGRGRGSTGSGGEADLGQEEMGLQEDGWGERLGGGGGGGFGGELMEEEVERAMRVIRPALLRDRPQASLFFFICMYMYVHVCVFM